MYYACYKTFMLYVCSNSEIALQSDTLRDLNKI